MDSRLMYPIIEPTVHNRHSSKRRRTRWKSSSKVSPPLAFTDLLQPLAFCMVDLGTAECSPSRMTLLPMSRSDSDHLMDFLTKRDDIVV